MMLFRANRLFRISAKWRTRAFAWALSGMLLSAMGLSARAETLYVDGGQVSSGDGQSWSQAFRTIGEALTTATAGTEIWVRSGTYSEAISMKSGVAVRGGFSGAETSVTERLESVGATILDGSRVADHTVVFQNVTTATLDAFVVTGGTADGLGTNASGGGVFFSGADASNLLSKCVIGGNRANISGGGVYGVQSSPVFESCQISGNSAHWGGGIYFEGGAPVLTNCVVAGNWGHFGSALNLNNSSPALIHCTVASNAATDQEAAGGSLYLNTSAPRLVNTIFQKNDKVAVYLNGAGNNPTLLHCLFFGNADGDFYQEETGVLSGANALNLKVTGATRMLEGDARFTQDFVEVSSATWTAEPVYDALTGRTILSNSSAEWTSGSLAGKMLNPNTAQSQLALVVDNTSSTLTVVGNVTGFVPLGASYRLADFHLLNGSAALDRASTETLSQVDFEGNARPGTDGVVDIGADEAPEAYASAADTVPPVSYALSLARLQTQPLVKIAWLASDAESGLAGVELFRSKDGAPFVSAGVYTQSPVSFDTATAGGDGQYAFYTVARDQGGNVESAPAVPDTETIAITSVASQRLYVDGDATDSALGTDWSHAFRSVKLALEVAAVYTTVTEVWVAEGVYGESIAPRSNLTLFGGFRGTETNLSERPESGVLTILDGSAADAGSPADHVVTLDRVKNVVLDGFTITGGRANGPLYSGGGVYCNLLFSNAVVIRRCVITGNAAEAQNANGGGILCYSSSPMIQNCIIAGNSAANYGGGMAMLNSSPVLENCVIAANGGYFGGGLYTENSSPIIRNCTIADNTILGGQANHLGGGWFCSGGSPVVQNTIFARNAKYAIHEHMASGDPVVARCLFEGNPDGDYSDYETGVWTGANALNMQVTGVSGSLEGDARFTGDQAGATSGAWTAAGVYDAATNRTALTDSSATLVTGSLVGRFIQPNVGQSIQAMVTSNSAVRIEVLGNVTSVVSLSKVWRVVDYHLTDGSAALDRATSSSAPVADFEGDARPGADGLFDLGADEAPAAHEPPADTIPPVSEALTLDPLQTQVAFDVPFLASDSESGLDRVELFYRKDGGAYVSAGTSETSPFRFDTSGRGDGAYDFYTVAYDQAGNAELPATQPDASTVVVTSVTGTRLYVDRKNTGSQSGMTWEKAYREIGTALRLAAKYPSIREIWIAGGVYAESLTVPSHVALYGGFSGTETVLTERNLEKYPSVVSPGAARGILLNDVTSVTLDGLVVTGGVANGSDMDGNGGGIACLNVDATNRILNCRIVGNSSLAPQGFGGGIYCYRSSPRIENCVVAGNRASGSGGGLGLYSSSPEIVNCTLAANSANLLGGGVYCFSSSPNIRNTIFTRNGQVAVHEANTSADPVVRFCLFYDNPNGDYSDYETGKQTGAVAINQKVSGASDNVDGNPSCQVLVAGVWSRIPAYDPATGTTVFTDDSGVLEAGKLVGLHVNLKTDQALEAIVTANTTTTLSVAGHVTYAELFDAYEVLDYRPGYLSAAIDTGTSVSVPVVDVFNHLRPVDLPGYGREGVGNAFDMGAYEVADLPVKPRPRMKTEPAWTTGTLNTVACYPFVGTTSYSLQLSTVPDFATSWTQEVALKPSKLTHTFTSLEDGHTYWYRVRALSDGELTSWSLPTFSTQDTGIPSGSILIDGGAATTSVTTVTLTLIAQDTGTTSSGVAWMRFREGTNWTSWEAYKQTRTWTLNSWKGVRTVEVEFRDRAGNASAVASDSIQFEPPAPKVLSVTPLETGPTTADAISFRIEFDTPVTGFSEVSDLLVVHDPLGNTDHSSVSLTTLSPTIYTAVVSGLTGTGYFTLSVKAAVCVDVVGAPNQASAPSPRVYLVKPGLRAAMIPEPEWTPGTQNTVEWLPVLDAVTYSVQRDVLPGFPQPLEVQVSSSTLAHIFTDLGDGRAFWYRVRAQQSGRGEPTAWSVATSSTQDAQQPSGSVVINNGDAVTPYSDVVLTLVTTDPGANPSGVTEMRLSNGAGWTEWEPVVAAKPWALLPGDGAKTVWVEYRDRAGNISLADSLSDSILLDTSAVPGPRVLAITPEDAGPTSLPEVGFRVEFDRAVTGFVDSSDVTVVHDPTGTTSHTSVVLEALSETVYRAQVGGIIGKGAVALIVNANACEDRDGYGNPAYGPSADVLIDPSIMVIKFEPEWTTGTANTVAWHPFRNAVRYTLQRDASEDFQSPEGVELSSATLAYTFSNLEDGRAYWYRVRASEVYGWTTSSLWSRPTSSTQDALPPTGSVLINNGRETASLRRVKLDLDWNDPGINPSGVALMRLREKGEWTGWEAVSTTQTWQLSFGIETKTVEAQFRDQAGNVSEPGTILDSIYFDPFSDLDAPTVTLISSVPNPTNLSVMPVVVTFNEPVEGFSIQGIGVDNATLTNFHAVDDMVFTFDLLPASQGLVSVWVVAGAAVDGAQNPSVASVPLWRLFDSVPPSGNMNSSTSDPTNLSLIPVTATFEEPVEGFTSASVVTENAALVNFVGEVGASVYHFDLAVSDIMEGEVTASVATGAMRDAAGNWNVSPFSFHRRFKRETVIPKPVGVSATDGTEVDQVTVTWEPGEGALKYRVYRSLEFGDMPELIGDGLTTTTFVDTQVRREITYYYQVQAVLDSELGVVSPLSDLDAGWADGSAVDYKISYSGGGLSVDVNGKSLVFAATSPKASLKIIQLKRLPQNAVSVPNKTAYYHGNVLAQVKMTGTVKTFLTQAPIKTLEASGAVLSISAQNCTIESLTGAGLGKIRMSATPNATDSTGKDARVLQTSIQSPTQFEKPVQVALNGIVLENLDLPKQQVQYLKVNSRKTSRNGTPAFLSQGDILGTVQAGELLSLTVTGGSLESPDLQVLAGLTPLKIVARAGVFNLGSKGNWATVVRGGDVAARSMDLAVQSAQIAASGGNIRGEQIVVAGELSSLSATFKKVRLGGVTRYLGGEVGEDLTSSTALTTYTLFVSGSDSNQAKLGIRSVRGSVAVQGYFVAGAVSSPDPENPLVPTLTGTIGRIQVQKSNPSTWGTTRIIGGSWSDPASPIQFKGVPLGPDKAPEGFTANTTAGGLFLPE